MMKEIDFMEIGGFMVGQAEVADGITGITGMLMDKQSPAGIDIRGGGPASRETPLLNSVADCKGLHAIILGGGSAYGLDAAGGVMEYLEEKGIGLEVGVARVPLVCQSDIFDLGIGDSKSRPDKAMARRACENASYNSVQQGNHGAGMGATVGKYRGPQFCMKGGIGTYAVEIEGLKVGAMVVVNACGDIYDIETNQVIAGCLNPDGTLVNDELAFFQDAAKMMIAAKERTNTTIGIVVTNAKMEKTALNKVASMAHNGYGRAIRPVHTMMDGDSIYAVSTGDMEADINLVGPLAAYVMGKAIGRGCENAESIAGVRAVSDLS